MRAEERKIEVTHWIGDHGTPTDIDGFTFETEEEAEEFDAEVEGLTIDFERNLRRLYENWKRLE